MSTIIYLQRLQGITSYENATRQDDEEYGNQLIVLWAWYFFVLNTVLTVLVLYNIACVCTVPAEL
jgi:hypothetical protein